MKGEEKGLGEGGLQHHVWGKGELHIKLRRENLKGSDGILNAP